MLQKISIKHNTIKKINYKYNEESISASIIVVNICTGKHNSYLYRFDTMDLVGMNLGLCNI